MVSSHSQFSNTKTIYISLPNIKKQTKRYHLFLRNMIFLELMKDKNKFNNHYCSQISTSSCQIKLFWLSGLGKPKSHGEWDEET